MCGLPVKNGAQPSQGHCLLSGRPLSETVPGRPRAPQQQVQQVVVSACCVRGQVGPRGRTPLQASRDPRLHGPRNAALSGTSRGPRCPPLLC